MKQLVACPQCQKLGRRYVLGEVASTGHILVQRTHGSNGQYRNFTIIGGDDFHLICDKCGFKVFFRKINNDERRSYESNNNGQEWVYRQSLGGTTGAGGLSSGGTAAPTIGTN